MQVFRMALSLYVLLLFGSVLGCYSSRSVAVQKAAGRGDTDAMVGYLDSADEWILEDACRGLVGHPQPETAQRLLEILVTPEAGPYARGQAARALGTLGDPANVPVLIRSFERAGHAEERFWVLQAVSRFCTDETRAFMEALQNDSDLFVSQLARGGVERCKVDKKEGDAR